MMCYNKLYQCDSDFLNNVSKIVPSEALAIED
jgi:hypothetical protein